eukprot:241096_1
MNASNNEKRKFFNKFNVSAYGLQPLFIKKYFTNNKNYLQYGKFLKSQKMVKSIIRCESSCFIADVMDYNTNTITNNIMIKLFQEPMKSERDIHPLQTQCNCSTYKNDKIKKSNNFIKEIMCPCIAAVLLCLVDGGVTTASFITKAMFITKEINIQNKLFIIDDLIFESSKINSLCPHPSQIFNDLENANKVFEDKYTTTFILSFGTSIRVKTPYCSACNIGANADMNKFVWTHKCPVYNSTNINKFTNRSTSVFALSVFFKDIEITKCMQIILKIAEFEYEPFDRLCMNTRKFSKQLFSLTFHRVATVCGIVMKQSKPFGRKEHPNIEADAGQCGVKRHGPVNNPYAYEQSWFLTSINRDPTHKGQKPMLSQVGGAESIQNYGSFMLKKWSPGANLNTDDHTLYKSNFVRNRWRQSGCNHSGKQFVNMDTYHYPSHLKGHDQDAECSMNKPKLQRRIHKGPGLINNGMEEQRQNWLYIINYKQTFTNGTAKDFLVTFMQHLSLLLDEQMLSLLQKYGWKETSS